MFALGAGWLVPLLITIRLDPNPRGLGTHRQLGLPPCTAVWLLGVRCPSCGMTTSWAHAVRGHWLDALAANAGGALLAAVTMIATPWLMASAACGRWLGWRPSERPLAAIAVAVTGVTMVDWLYRLLAG